MVDSFIDKAPIDWSDPKSGRLRALLVQAYPDLDWVRLLMNRLGLPTAGVVVGLSVLEVWTGLIEQASRLGLLRALVEAVLQDPAVAAFHAPLAELLEEGGAAEQGEVPESNEEGLEAPDRPGKPLDSRLDRLSIRMATGLGLGLGGVFGVVALVLAIFKRQLDALWLGVAASLDILSTVPDLWSTVSTLFALIFLGALGWAVFMAITGRPVARDAPERSGHLTLEAEDRFWRRFPIVVALALVLAVSTGLIAALGGGEVEPGESCPEGWVIEESICVWPTLGDESGDMVKVPAGFFIRGSEDGGSGERPQREVWLDEFRIDRFEVTVGQYRKCVKAGECSDPTTREDEFAEYYNWGKEGREAHPINGVSWSQAVAYCQSLGKRLPTEAEWEKAARGVKGQEYPWGDEAPGKGTPVYGNFADESAKKVFKDRFIFIVEGYDDGAVGTAPVGSFEAGVSPYGAYDMAGNVSEWVEDVYDRGYYARAPERNPVNRDTESGSLRVVRGGGFGNSAGVRAAYRDHVTPGSAVIVVGFRCAR